MDSILFKTQFSASYSTVLACSKSLVPAISACDVLPVGPVLLQIWNNTVSWSKGASGTQSFWISLQYSPNNSRLTLQLTQPQGAVLDPAASTAAVTVQSPIIGFKTALVSP